MPDVAVIIAAGGRGRRMGGRIPKQFLRLGGVPILQRTIAVFDALREIGEIVLVVPPTHIRRAEAMVRRGKFIKVCRVVAGGRERQESVARGLGACSSQAALVLVHDAVRPLVEPRVILDVIREARKCGAAAACVRVKDTLKVESSRGGMAVRTHPRAGMWAAQTPQGFRKDLLVRAHEAARRSSFLGTDEASLIERLGIGVRIVEGSERNVKITTPGDRRLAEFLLKSTKRRRPAR